LLSDGRSRSDVEKREYQGRMSHRRTWVEADVTGKNEQNGDKKICTARKVKTMFGDG
jgi:hypothetical protein